MKALFIAALLLATVALAKRPKWHELSADYSHEQYMKDFHKTYRSESEKQMRKEVFERHLKDILKHNSQAKVSYNMGVNQFTDRTEEEFKRSMGSRSVEMAAVKQQLRKQKHVKEHVSSGLPLPKSVDYRNAVPPVLTAVKNQGHCGSCWAHGSTETLESHYAMKTGELFVLSQEQMTQCAPNPDSCGGTGGCEGSIIELAYDYIIKAGGQSEEWKYPYTSYEGRTGTCNTSKITPVATMTGYTNVKSNSYGDVMDALAFRGPLGINVAAMPWMHYEGGVFDGCTYNITVDHVVQLVGYGTDFGPNGQDYWIVRNSWSPAWGENGYIRLVRNANPVCGWDVHPSQGTGCKGGPSSLWMCGQCGLLYDTVYPNID